MKKILAVSYTQSGQLTSVLSSLLAPLMLSSDIEIYEKAIKPLKDFPYPWDAITFMDTFPESVAMIPCQLDEKDFINDENDYDLIILAYQAWFLSPSVPISSFLQSSYAKAKFANKPVITLIACRNMWIEASKQVNFLLSNLGAKLIDNIVLTDQGASYATFVTTPRWLLTGKKDKFLGIFPEAGVSKNDIKNASRFGKAILQGLKNNDEKSFKSMCQGLEACCVNAGLIRSEKLAKRSFVIWGKMIRKFGKSGDKKRLPFVMLYLVFLILIILTIVPINMLLGFLSRKINPEKTKELKEFYELPSGNKSDRMKDFL